jgi:5'-nucleotidase
MKKNFFVTLLLLSSSFPLGCSTASQPMKELPKGDQYETVAILGTNDIHGALAAMDLKTREYPGVSPTPYQAGGMAVMGSYVRILQKEFGDHLIWLDAGDEFQGTLESNSQGGAPMVRSFNTLGLNAAAIGNHEFDFGVANLKQRMSEAKYPYLAANIYDRKTKERAQFPNTLPHVLLQAGRLKIGVIGLSTLETPTTTRPENVKRYEFKDLTETTLREAAALRKEGADIIVITSHVGLKCDLSIHPESQLRTQDQKQGACDPKSEIVQFLNSLPPGTVDAVVSGHSHQVVHHWIDGIPVVQGGVSGRYINVIYLTYDFSKHRLMRDETQIEGPIPVCEKVFKNRGDCNGDVLNAPGADRGELVRASFHGTQIQPDAKIQTQLKPVLEHSTRLKNQIIAFAARPLEHPREAESEVGNLVADAVRDSVSADIAILNNGGIRAPWEAGPITYGDVYRTLPFDNFIVRLKLKGRELKTLLSIVESGSKGISPVSGVRMKLIPLHDPAPSNDMNGDGKIESWEFNRILKVTLQDGTPIHDSKSYTVATLDFLIHGGDDWAWFISQLKGSALRGKSGELERDATIHRLRKLNKQGPINSTEHPLIDPERPRFTFK